MNFKDLLKIINEESREKADSFRTTGEAVAKDKAKANATPIRLKMLPESAKSVQEKLQEAANPNLNSWVKLL